MALTGVEQRGWYVPDTDPTTKRWIIEFKTRLHRAGDEDQNVGKAVHPSRSHRRSIGHDIAHQTAQA
eukprot:6136675-Pyramimonas_sp.AAC.1